MPTLTIDQLLYSFSIIGTIVFAVSGALFAAEKRMDILGFILVGTVTGIGGGTLRDLLLGISPVSWVQNPLTVYICIVASALTYFTVELYRNRDAWILWTDAIGLAVFAVMGAQTALAHQVPSVIAVVMGVMTATFGGLMRDVLCAEVLTLMRPEIYISCALSSAVMYVALYQWGVGDSVAAGSAFLAGFGLRAAAIRFKLTLPRFGA
ncbi:trimeric intracellular cation channel family protein [uncultured Zhongshania sp.]|uniref:trimeric intracellular cation channel family protein n=1 Tax=uncultured Zhongshania sp. TaxID=1642288 RepID=UPI0025F0F2C7|nr:trimeric intracellular cation channel family protein [uncultured Zhongshania sp.]